MKWIRRLLGLCEHEWAVLQQSPLFPSAGAQLPCGEEFILQCKKCGNLKQKTFIAKV